ncbi:MAG: molybdopterin-guanine dinucleotide biosynthesis protein B [Methylophilus sp.]|jgi:molybdopterin-guanine dinucleotide biosynthesis protein MobB
MHKLPVLGIVAASSKVGKTTLVTQLIPALAKRNIRVSVIKHAHHRFDIDYPGKDSYKIRQAGAIQTLIASNQRWALMTELAQEPDVETLIAQINPSYADLILVEGFKLANIPKIEVHRPSLGLPLLAENDSNIIAIASDATLHIQQPVLSLNNIEQIVAFIGRYFELEAPSLVLK